MKPLPLFGSGTQSYSAFANAQRRLNCFFDIRQDGDRAQVIIRGTPGTSLWITLPQAPIRGWKVVNNVLYVVANKNFYSVSTAGAVIFLGSLTTTSGYVGIADNGVQVIVVDGTFGYTFTLSGSVWAKITDVNFPNGCNSVAFLDGTFYVEVPNSRKFQASQIYDGTNWTPNTFGAKENESSQLLAVEVTAGTLILWGNDSIEFWQNAGLSPLPVQRIPGTTQTWGLAAVQSRAVINATIGGKPVSGAEVFLGKDPHGHAQVLILNGYTPMQISDSDIEYIINSFSTVSDAVVLTYLIDGHTMYQITFPTGGRSFLYDLTASLWHEVQSGTELVARHFARYGVAFNLQNYVTDDTTGNLYLLDENAYTDNGATIKRQLRSRHLRNAGNTFGISELFIDMETGVGLQSGQGSAPMLMISKSKDGGRTFGNERQVPIGAVGQYLTRVITRRWGMARDHVFQITMTDPVKFLIADASAVPQVYEGAQQ